MPGFALPIAHAPSPDDAFDDAARDGHPIQEIHVLIVDDDESIHADFDRVLAPDLDPCSERLEGLAATLFGTMASTDRNRVLFRVRHAMQGIAAADFVHKASEARCPVDVAFVDMRMPPGENGVETTARLWQTDPLLQVVLCTAYSDFSWADVMRSLSTAEHLHPLRKPFSPLQVRQIARVLGTRPVACARPDPLQRRRRLATTCAISTMSSRSSRSTRFTSDDSRARRAPSGVACAPPCTSGNSVDTGTPIPSAIRRSVRRPGLL